MAAKLEWKKRALLLDGEEIGRIKRWGVGGWTFRVSCGEIFMETEPDKYETQSDAQQDLEREVRRLLREAGVEVA